MRALRAGAFDRRFLALTITSEQGAASMARTELVGGQDATSRKLTTSIASAPTIQIPELRTLLAAFS